MQQPRDADRGEPDSTSWPHIAAALALSQNAAISDQIKVMVLGDCPAEEIADQFGLDARILTNWEGLFFDVRSARRASSWILNAVIQSEQQKGKNHLASQMKFAHAGGPVAAKAILMAESRVAIKQGVDLFDKKICLHMKFDQAINLSVETDKAKMFLIKCHADLLHREQRLRMEQRKLAQRCQEALWK